MGNFSQQFCHEPNIDTAFVLLVLGKAVSMRFQNSTLQAQRSCVPIVWMSLINKFSLIHCIRFVWSYELDCYIKQANRQNNVEPMGNENLM